MSFTRDAYLQLPADDRQVVDLVYFLKDFLNVSKTT